MEDEDVDLGTLVEGFDLPEGALVVGMMRVIRYFDAEGNEQVHFKFDGDQSLSQSVGMLELAKNAYVRDAYEDGDDAT